MPPQHETDAFCLALKAARKRRGLTLETIADQTKVCVSYYAGLEANDLKHWPKGLFRRAFFRGYIEAIGLPVAQTIDDFVRLFPEDDPVEAAAAPPPDTSFRLALDRSWHGARPSIGVRVLTATIDAAIVGSSAGSVAFVTPVDFAAAAAAIAVIYFTLGTLVFGETPAAWLRRWVPSRTDQSPNDSEPAGAGGEKPEDRVWVSDARRVRPRDTTARLRVRFKSSP
jgi:transcriptional regulator with XRE-family HTH domain